MYIYIVIVPCWCVNSRIWSLSFSCLPQSRCHMSVCSRIDSPLFFPKCAHIQRKSDKFPWQTHGTRRAILHLETHLIHMVFLLSRTSVQKVWSPDPELVCELFQNDHQKITWINYTTKPTTYEADFFPIVTLSWWRKQWLDLHFGTNSLSCHKPALRI